MKVAILCEFSGIVREAFRRRGHDAISCDLERSEILGPHIVGDCLDQDWRGYDLVIAHPPCRYLAVSGARWFKQRQTEQAKALAFVAELLALPVPRLALENPVSVIATHIRKPDQVIQPWQFGHPERKTTCLWLRGLPPLEPTAIVNGQRERVHRLPPTPLRSRIRNRTYPGIAAAMAEQWGGRNEA